MRLAAGLRQDPLEELERQGPARQSVEGSSYFYGEMREVRESREKGGKGEGERRGREGIASSLFNFCLRACVLMYK